MKKILFVVSPSTFTSYSSTRASSINMSMPLLSFLSLGAVAKQAGKRVEVLDLGIICDWKKALIDKINEFKPDMIGMTSMTPLFMEVAEISFFIRQLVGKSVILIVGGPHPTALPVESLRQSAFDILVAGEGEKAFSEMLSGKSYKEIPGVYYKEGGDIFSTPGYSSVDDFESLPYPAYDLYDLNKYSSAPKMIARTAPFVNFMTSRGCPYKCCYCNKNIFATKVKYKSPEYIIGEIKFLLRAGIKEIHIGDDLFTANIKRAKTILELILKNNLRFPWSLTGGLRTDSVDFEFLTLAKKTGCFLLGFGFESGDQQTLDAIGNKSSIEQAFKIMKLVKKVGIDSVGYFMLGLPNENEDSLKKTINFAKKLHLTYAKVTITVPFPGTKLFDDYERAGLIKSRDWSKYNFHDMNMVKDIYQHPHLSMETLVRYYNKFYYSFYLRPSYLAGAFFRGIRDGSLFYLGYYGLQTFFPKIFSRRVKRY